MHINKLYNVLCLALLMSAVWLCADAKKLNDADVELFYNLPLNEQQAIIDSFKINSKEEGAMFYANILVNKLLDTANYGSYTKSVVFHGGLYHNVRTLIIPWGTKRAPDAIEQVTDFSNFTVDIRRPTYTVSGRAIRWQISGNRDTRRQEILSEVMKV